MAKKKRKVTMKACDYGHDAPAVRRLSIGGGAGIFLCKKHWAKEMRWRRMRNKQLARGAKFPIRKWPGK